MKKFLLGMMGIGVAVGLFAANPVVYAGEPTPQTSEEDVYAQKVDEFRVVLLGEPATSIFEENAGGDLVYEKAHDAVETYLAMYGDDGSAELTKLVDARREVALSLYEQNFGPWEGTPSEFVEFLSQAGKTPLKLCGESAIRACGKGKVKSVTVSGNSCHYECFPATP